MRLALRWSGHEGSWATESRRICVPRIDQGGRELALADRLDAIRLTLSDSADGKHDDLRCDRAYEEEFRRAGLGAVLDEPNVVADRIGASNIPSAIVAALYHWSSLAKGQARNDWLLEVAQRAEPIPTDWRNRARASREPGDPGRGD